MQHQQRPPPQRDCYSFFSDLLAPLQWLMPARQEQPDNRFMSDMCSSMDMQISIGREQKRLRKNNQLSLTQDHIGHSGLPERQGQVQSDQDSYEGDDEEDLAEAIAESQLPALLRIMQITWNQMGQEQPQGVLDQMQDILQAQHIVSVATQECGRSILKSLLVSGKAGWEQNVLSTLGDQFVQLEQVSENAMHLVLFIRKSLVPFVDKVETGRVSTGVANIVYNKGGLSVGLQLQGHSLLFVNCHLSSGQQAVARRLKDFEQIEKGTLLKQTSKYQHDRLSHRFDSVIWAGDMNFRIENTLEEVRRLLGLQDMNGLFQHDQLSLCKAESVLSTFQEAPVLFPPTYKLQPKGTEYQLDKRMPGWTDRVLFKSKGLLSALKYDWVPQLSHSDHRPVYCQFTYRL